MCFRDGMFQRWTLFPKRSIFASYSKWNRGETGLSGNWAISERTLKLKTTEIDSDDLNEKRGSCWQGNGPTIEGKGINQTPERPGTRGTPGLPTTEMDQCFFRGLLSNDLDSKSWVGELDWPLLWAVCLLYIVGGWVGAWDFFFFF